MLQQHRQAGYIEEQKRQSALCSIDKNKPLACSNVKDEQRCNSIKDNVLTSKMNKSDKLYISNNKELKAYLYLTKQQAKSKEAYKQKQQKQQTIYIQHQQQKAYIKQQQKKAHYYYLIKQKGSTYMKDQNRQARYIQQQRIKAVFYYFIKKQDHLTLKIKKDKPNNNNKKQQIMSSKNKRNKMLVILNNIIKKKYSYKLDDKLNEYKLLLLLKKPKNKLNFKLNFKL